MGEEHLIQLWGNCFAVHSGFNYNYYSPEREQKERNESAVISSARRTSSSSSSSSHPQCLLRYDNPPCRYSLKCFTFTHQKSPPRAAMDAEANVSWAFVCHHHRQRTDFITLVVSFVECNEVLNGCRWCFSPPDDHRNGIGLNPKLLHDQVAVRFAFFANLCRRWRT